MTARSVVEHALRVYGYSEKVIDELMGEIMGVMPGDDKRPTDRPTGPGKDKPQPPWRTA